MENQLLIALIIYCLMILLKMKVCREGALLEIKMLLRTCLYESFTKFVQKLHQKSGRHTKGRRCVDHERIFKATVEQYDNRQTSLSK